MLSCAEGSDCTNTDSQCFLTPEVRRCDVINDKNNTQFDESMDGLALWNATEIRVLRPVYMIILFTRREQVCYIFPSSSPVNPCCIVDRDNNKSMQLDSIMFNSISKQYKK